MIFVKDVYPLAGCLSLYGFKNAYRLLLTSLRASLEFIYESESMALLC